MFCRFTRSTIRYRMKPCLSLLFTLFLLSSTFYFFYSLTNQIQDHELLLRNKQAQIDFLTNKISNLQFRKADSNLPVIYAITPTYSRPVQLAELTRLLNVFRQVSNLHWIIVEDSSTRTDLVKNLLQVYPQNYTHLNVVTPKHHKIQPKEKWWKKPRGVLQRNLALRWLRESAPSDKGVIYFCDDDNTYTVDLFDEIRHTKKVSVLPVGLVGGVLVESPKVKDGKVVGWNVGWGTERPFAIDMAGFAVNLKFFLDHKGVEFKSKVKIGHQESEFLKQLVTLPDLEPVSVGRILVWHTRTETPNLNQEENFKKKHGRNTDFGLQDYASYKVSPQSL